jgi:cation diffusion facilitator family transporter
MNQNRLKYLVALLSVFSNAGLVVVKFAVGVAIGSISVMSEAIHSGVDVFAAIVAVVGVKRAGEPADKDHPYGHGKFENLSGLIQAMLIFAAAAWIIWESALKLLKPRSMETVAIGVGVMFVSAAVNALVAWILMRVANKTDSIALKADAWHCLTDVYTSLGVMAGLAVMWAAQKWLPSVSMSWVDPVAAIAVALLITKAAYGLSLESVRDLLDVALPRHEEDAIKEMLRQRYPKVMGFHNFRTRRSGIVRFVEFHLLVDPKMSVEDGHVLHHTIAAQVKQKWPGSEVIIHIEPCDRSCEPKCLEFCFDQEARRKGVGAAAV